MRSPPSSYLSRNGGVVVFLLVSPSFSDAELSTHFDIMDSRLRYIHNVPIELIKNNKSFTDPDSSSIAPTEQRGHRNKNAACIRSTDHYAM